MEMKAVIFDMDGVLIDSEIVYIEWEKEFFRQYGIELSDEAYRKTLGHSDSDVEEALEKIWRAYGRKEDFKALREAYYDAPKFHDMDYSMILNDGVRETLAYLKKMGKKLALASSSSMPEIEKVLGDCGLAEYFQAVVSGEQFDESKPNPGIYLYTAEELGILPEACMAVEDSEAGIAAAKAAGMYVAAKREERFRVDQSQADTVIETLRELIGI